MQKNYTSTDAVPLILFLFGRHWQPNVAPLLKAKLCIMLFHNNICFLILRVCNCYTSYLWTKNQTNLSYTLEATITKRCEGCVIGILSVKSIECCTNESYPFISVFGCKMLKFTPSWICLIVLLKLEGRAADYRSSFVARNDLHDGKKPQFSF